MRIEFYVTNNVINNLFWLGDIGTVMKPSKASELLVNTVIKM